MGKGKKNEFCSLNIVAHLLFGFSPPVSCTGGADIISPIQNGVGAVSAAVILMFQINYLNIIMVIRTVLEVCSPAYLFM